MPAEARLGFIIMVRIRLAQDTDIREPSLFEVIYTFSDETRIWHVTPIEPYRDRAVIMVNCAHDLINHSGVLSRTLRGHYPSAPMEVDYAITHVDPAG